MPTVEEILEDPALALEDYEKPTEAETERWILEWYKKHKPDGYLKVKRVFDSYHRLMRNGHGARNA